MDEQHQQRGQQALKVAALMVCAVVLIRHAWVSDDAFITLRCVRNFIAGDGLRWNVHERVQSFTHPLWMLLLSGVYGLVESPMAAALTLSLGLSLVTLYWILFRLELSTPAALLVAALLISSKSFVDYASSGLENSLTHFLAVWLFAEYGRGISASANPVAQSRRFAFRTTLIMSLLALTRFDTALVALPFLVVAFWRLRDTAGAAIKILAVGLLPFVLWEAFAIIYFGFPFPNPAYAKLANGVPISEVWIQGAYYYLSQVSFDPISLVCMGIALTLFLVKREPRHRALALSVTIYILYIVAIGGDFMAGRFLTLPLLMSALLFASELPGLLSRRRGVVYAPAVLAVIAGATLTAHPTLGTGADYTLGNNPISKNPWDERGIADERAYYSASSSFMRMSRTHLVPNDWRMARGTTFEPGTVQTVSQAGVVGFFAPPTVILVDVYGLTDAFLARLPPVDTLGWRPGHFTRAIPDGYLESLRDGRNHITDAKLARLYDRISLVTAGPIWSKERWLEIVRLNLGIEPPPPEPIVIAVPAQAQVDGPDGGAVQDSGESEAASPHP